MFVLKNARLISQLTEDYDETLADIVVNDGKIEKINFPGKDYGDLEIVDLEGKTLLPGMFDLHMHPHFKTMDFLAILDCPTWELAVNAMSYGVEMLKQGFTTIRSCGDIKGEGYALKEAAERKLIKGPRVYTCGTYISPTTRGVDGMCHVADGVDELLKACREEYAAGADFIKYMATGSVGSEKGVPGALISSREELFALQSIAETIGTYAAAHCHGKEGIMLCAEAGIRTIEHASYIDDECIELILQKGGKSAIVPTLGPIGLMREGLMSEAVSKKAGEQSVKEHKMLTASRAGVLTGWGTDVSLDFFRRNPGIEFALRSERGYTNLEILEQATINSAKILGLQDELGTIKPGKLADFVIIDGNPDEDITVMCNHPFAVYKEGERMF